MFVRRAFRSRKVYRFRRRYPKVFAFLFSYYCYIGAREDGKWTWKKSHTHLAVDEKAGLHREKALLMLQLLLCKHDTTIRRTPSLLYQHNHHTAKTSLFSVTASELTCLDHNIGNTSSKTRDPFWPQTAVDSSPWRTLIFWNV